MCTQDTRPTCGVAHGVAVLDGIYESRCGLVQGDEKYAGLSKLVRMTIGGSDRVDSAEADDMGHTDEADAGMGDAERDASMQDRDADEWDESSSSASVDVSSGYDDSSSSDGVDDSNKSKHESTAGWKEPARMRNSDRLLDLIQVFTHFVAAHSAR